MLKNLCLAFSFTAAAFLSGCNSSQPAPAPRNELVVVMDEEMPGYFVLDGESYGYQYDLFKAYADARGKTLRVVEGQKASLCAELLARGEVDALTTLSGHITPGNRPSEVPIYRTSYVLLCGRKLADPILRNQSFDPISVLRGHKLLVSEGFKDSKTYNTLLDSLPVNLYVSSRNSFELIEALADGTYDFLICEQSEAQLGCAFNRQVAQVYTFSEEVPLSAVFTPLDPALKADFETWLDTYRRTPEYAMLNDLYFERGIVGELLDKGARYSAPGRISAYDELFKRVCRLEGYDWRLISAIAYQESRFNPHVVSPRGARGLMQVMPRVASQFGLSGDLADPEHNVLLALKLLGKIEKTLRFSADTPQSDRMQLMLACYNAGVGHVLDARNLARKYGADPDSWADVSAYLTLKSDPQIAGDEAVKCGIFNGRQTLAFVDKVVARYRNYCNRVEL